MPLYDVRDAEGNIKEVYVLSSDELKKHGYEVLPSRIHVGGRPTEETLSDAILRGYRRQEAKGAKFVYNKNQVTRALSNC